MMRLLQLRDGELTLTNHGPRAVPKYAILSHTWGADTEEVTFQDLIQKQGKDKKGYKKLLFCGEQAKRDGLDYFWVDTCCIDKADYTELSTALNSMFRWYQNAVHCYTYLSDVSTSSKNSWESQFRRSRWFQRGWTLQELLAPASVKFYSVEGNFLSDKTEMVDVIHDITKIKVAALQGASLAQFPIHERMNWSRRRQTKEEEDIAYCLFGIFDVFIPLIYGEGEQNAMSRLEEAIEKRTGAQGPGTPIPRQTSHLILPFGRNEDFVGREDILSQLVNRITPSARKFYCQRTALEGLGGVGKTQIALEAAYRVHARDSRCSIFWVPAISMTSFENAYREIGRALGIPGLNGDQTDIKTKVKLALEQSTTEWLLIIDNVDDISLLSEGGLQKYLPFNNGNVNNGNVNNGNGSIFFTTRNHEVAVQLDVLPKHIYTLEEMSEDEALQLLQNNLKPRQYQNCPEATKDLIKHLVYLPLAIKQASAYLSKTGETTEAYLKYCLASDNDQMKLLDVQFEDRWRYSRNTNPITTTLLISFQHLEQSYPLAAEYLQFICFLAEKDIPISLLFPGNTLRATVEAVGILEGYAFISLREQSQSFDFNRLVRLATRNWIKAEWNLHCLKAVQHINLMYPAPEHENRKVWASYLPHVQSILAECDWCENELAVVELSSKLATSYDELERYMEVEEMPPLVIDGEDNDKESDTSDVQSIMTIQSETSSQSSAPSHREVYLAASELAIFLLEGKELNRMLTVAYSKVGKEKFRRNIGRLLKAWGRSLRTEVSGNLEYQVTQFVQKHAKLTAIELVKRLAIDPDHRLLKDGHSRQDKRRQLEEWMESLDISSPQDTYTEHNTHLKSSDISDHDQESSDEDLKERSDDEDENAHINLRAAKAFLRSSKALSGFRSDLQQWLNGKPPATMNNPPKIDMTMVYGSADKSNLPNKRHAEDIPRDYGSLVSVGRQIAPQLLKSQSSKPFEGNRKGTETYSVGNSNALRKPESPDIHEYKYNSDENNLAGDNQPPQLAASQSSQDVETDSEDSGISPTTETPLLWDSESQTDRHHSMSKSRWQYGGLALLHSTYRSSYQSISDFITTLSYPKVPDGNIRISWRSARGRLMYMDLETTDQEEALMIEARFRGSSSLAQQPGLTSPKLISPLHAHQNSPLAYLPSKIKTSIPITSQGHGQTASQASIQTSTPSPRVGNVLRKKYLLLCYSVGDLHYLAQMEATEHSRDRPLFQAIRREFLELESEIHSAWYVKLPRKFRWLKVNHVGFVQFNVMFVGGRDRPEFVASGYPPENEVDHNWHYDPCPRSASGFDISSAFIQTLLDPEHASSDRKAWYLLLPKKVNTRFDERLGGGCLAYGLQIKEGRNPVAIVLAWLFSLLLSGIIGAICAKTIDTSSGFTIAAWIGGIFSGLTIACLALLPP